MRLSDLTPASIGEIPYLIHRVTATVQNKIIREWAVLSQIHNELDPSGTGRMYAEMIGMREFIAHSAEHAINRIKSLNYTEMEGGEPLFPAEAQLSAEPMEFEVTGIEELWRRPSQAKQDTLVSMNALYEEMSLLLDPDSKMTHNEKVDRLKTLVSDKLRSFASKLLAELKIRVIDRADSSLPEWEAEAERLKVI